MLTMSDSDFSRLYRFMNTHYGIDFSKKKTLVESRLANLIIRGGYGGFTDFIDRVIVHHRPDELDMMLNRLTTNYTYFMRESNHFEFLQHTVLAELKARRGPRQIRVWSAGCSTGEEPYTIAMCLKDALGSSASLWGIQIMATDISTEALCSAQAACYTESALSALPVSWRRRYFTKQSDDAYQVTPEIRSLVTFRRFNLMDDAAFGLGFDVVFCRNVMIYFDLPAREGLIQRFFRALSPGGYLLIGHSESLNRNKIPLQYLMPAIYRKMP